MLRKQACKSVGSFESRLGAWNMKDEKTPRTWAFLNSPASQPQAAQQATAPWEKFVKSFLREAPLKPRARSSPT